MLTFRGKTDSIIYCADVPLLLLVASGGLLLIVALFFCADFLCFIALNAIWPHFLGTELRFYHILYP